MAQKLKAESIANIREQAKINELAKTEWSTDQKTHSENAAELARMHTESKSRQNQRLALSHIVKYLGNLERKIATCRIDNKEMRRNLNHTIPAQILFGSVIADALQGDHAPLAAIGANKLLGILTTYPYSNPNHPKIQVGMLNKALADAAANNDTSHHVEKIMKAMPLEKFQSIHRMDDGIIKIIDILKNRQIDSKISKLGKPYDFEHFSNSEKRRIYARTMDRIQEYREKIKKEREIKTRR